MKLSMLNSLCLEKHFWPRLSNAFKILVLVGILGWRNLCLWVENCLHLTQSTQDEACITDQIKSETFAQRLRNRLQFPQNTAKKTRQNLHSYMRSNFLFRWLTAAASTVSKSIVSQLFLLTQDAYGLLPLLKSCDFVLWRVASLRVQRLFFSHCSWFIDISGKCPKLLGRTLQRCEFPHDTFERLHLQK